MPEKALARVVTSLCALALFAALHEVERRGLLFWTGRFHPESKLLTFGSMALVAALVPWFPARLRAKALLAGSLLVGALLLRWLIVVPLLLAWLAPRITRMPWHNWQKLAVLLGVWVAVPVLAWFAPRGYGLRYTELGLYWTCLPAPLICLVVERGRGQLDAAEPLDEWLYLLAFPRFFMPFLQPIGAARFIGSWQKYRAPKLALSGLALGLYGLLGFFAIQYTHYAIKNPSDAFPLPQDAWLIGQNALRIYAFNATIIFCAVAQLRLLGYELGSGFRFPFLSSSVSEFYRRWNYYFFEYSTSIFYLPLSARLRRWMPVWLAYVLAGYPSILLGVWALDNVFAQLPLGLYGKQMFDQLTDWRELAAYFFVWSLIILPQVALTPLRRLRRFAFWRIGGRIMTIGLAVGILGLFFFYGVTLY